MLRKKFPVVSFIALTGLALRVAACQPPAQTVVASHSRRHPVDIAKVSADVTGARHTENTCLDHVAFCTERPNDAGNIS
jgi:hypothetical protein